jgi:uncharacterized membrane protein (Fun14 family)
MEKKILQKYGIVSVENHFFQTLVKIASGLKQVLAMLGE